MIKEGPDLVAAIDLGSNSFHMKVARVVDGRLHVVDRMKDMVRLAAGLDDRNRLSDEARGRAIASLERFGQRLRHVPPESVRAVGTNTMRRAKNAGAFMRAAEAALNHRIEIISGVEEARMVYLGVAHSVAPDDSKRLVIDIGGGSTELIIGEQFTPMHMESLYMGCVSMSQKFFPKGRIRRKRMREAILAAQQELEPIEETYRRTGWQATFGSSGTAHTAARVIRENGWNARAITLEGLYHVHDALVDAGSVDDLELAGLSSERRPVIPGGIAILIAVFETLGIEEMTCSDGALREGLLYDIIGRLGDADVREDTIDHLCKRYHVFIEQADRVARTAADLLRQTASAWQLDDDDAARHLGWSSRLHEIGLSVSHSHYHKHGAYLLEHSDLLGFSQQEQALLAALVRSHRRKIPLDLFNDASAYDGERALRLTALLRLAVVLHRSRSQVSLPNIVASATTEAIRLEFPDGYLGEHPLTEADLDVESQYLQGAGINLDVA